MNSYIFDEYKITELSYFEYKNLIKNLLSTQEDKLHIVFENVINEKVSCEKNLTIYDKIKILLLLRSLTLGEEISITVNNKLYNYNINSIIDSIKYTKSNFIYKNMKFTCPTKIKYASRFSCLIDNFYSFEIDNEIKNVYGFTYDQKEQILQNLIGFEVKELILKLDEYLNNFNLEYINNTKINLYDPNLITLIKNLYETDLNEMYDIEFNIMNHLKFNPSVFDRYGLPELRIFLNKYIKEKEEENKKVVKKNMTCK